MRHTRAEILEQIAGDRVVGIVRAADAGAARTAVKAMLDAGLRTVEVSLTTTGALKAIAAMAAEGWPVGAGTVLDGATARTAILAGARFLVCPTLAPSVIRVGRRYGAPVVAGVATPTEALRALELGADLVKVFPARAWSPAAVADVLQALPQLPLVPTGGIAVEDAPAWIAAGAVAVGMGSALAAGDPGEGRARVQALLASLREARA